MSFPLDQEITYWLPVSNNGSGGITYAVGVLADAKIADVNEIIFTKEGKQQHATRAVYTRVPLPIGAKFIEADHEAVAVPVSGSQLVIKASSNSSMTDMNRALS